MLEKYLSEKKRIRKKLIRIFFLSESGGCDKHDVIYIFVYQMGRLCGGAHEISDIKASLFSVGGWCGWWDWWCAGKEWGEWQGG